MPAAMMVGIEPLAAAPLRILTARLLWKSFYYDQQLAHCQSIMINLLNIRLFKHVFLLKAGRTTTKIYLRSIGEAEPEAMAVYTRACREPHLGESLTQ
jgi:hypothetical protein